MKKLLGISLSVIMAFSLNINTVKAETIVYDGKEEEYVNTNIGVRIDGEVVEYDGMYPVILKNRTLVPVREIMESPSINASVEWNNETKTVSIRHGDKTVTLTEGDSKAYVNGVELLLDSEAKLIKDKDIGTYKLMVPIRFISESLGYDVDWDKELQEVVLTNVSEARKALAYEDSNINSLLSVADVETLPTRLKNNPMVLETISDEEVIELKDGESNGSNNNVTINEIVGNSNQSKFYIQANGAIGDVLYSVTDEKLIIDIDGLIMGSFPTVIRMDDGVYVSAVRTSQSDFSPYKARIVFDLYDRTIPKEINFSSDRSSIEVTFNEVGLSKINVSQDNVSDIITLEGDYTDYATFRVNEPNGIIFDLNNCNNLIGDKNLLGVHGQMINNIYLGSLDSKTTRMLVETSGDSDYSLSYNESSDITTIRFTPLEIKQVAFNYETYPMLVIPKVTTLNTYDLNQITTTNSDLGFSTKLSFNTVINELNEIQTFYVGDVNTNSIEFYTYDGNTSLMFKNRHIIEYQITEDDSNVYITGIRPKDLYNKMVLLDAGHGGYQPGAVYNGLLEKDVNLKLMNYIRNYTELREDVKYFYTRIDDTASSLPDRVKIANDLEVDLLVSMHNNAIDISRNSLLTAVRGMEVITTIDTETSANELVLAQSIFANMKAELPELILREIKDYNKLYLLRYSDMPAVIIEYAYLTNPEDVANLKQEWILEEAARITEDTIYNYMK